MVKCSDFSDWGKELKTTDQFQKNIIQGHIERERCTKDAPDSPLENQGKKNQTMKKTEPTPNSNTCPKKSYGKIVI